MIPVWNKYQPCNVIVHQILLFRLVYVHMFHTPCIRKQSPPMSNLVKT